MDKDKNNLYILVQACLKTILNAQLAEFKYTEGQLCENHLRW